jgi:hypothetical protein
MPAFHGVVRLWTKTAETLWDLDEFPSATTTALLTPGMDNGSTDLNDFASRTPVPTSFAPPSQQTRATPAQQAPKTVWEFDRFISPSPSPCLPLLFRITPSHLNHRVVPFRQLATIKKTTRRQTAKKKKKKKKKKAKQTTRSAPDFWRERRSGIVRS